MTRRPRLADAGAKIEPMQATPISRAALVERLVELIDQSTGDWVRVALDGAPPTDPVGIAGELVGPLNVRGRAAQVIRTNDFWQPASLRLEFGRTNPDSFYDNWIDVSALQREVLAPTGPGGTGRILPSRWNAATERATRADYVDLARGGVVLLCGQFLLGGPLTVDLSVHLAMSVTALRRHTEAEAQWTVPAYERYYEEVAPQDWADVVVRMDDPRRPALARPHSGRSSS